MTMNDTTLSVQFTIALISTYALQWLKETKFFPWLTTETQALNRAVSLVIAFLASAGILVGFDHTAGVLTISGLTAANLLHAASRFVQQWAMQQAAYKGLVMPPRPGTTPPSNSQETKQ
jgi:hypothetical protein